MGPTSNCGCSIEQVDLMFKRAEQYIDEQITDRTYQMARYWVDLYSTKTFPDGVGLVLEKLRFFGDIGPQYDGHDGWRKVQITRRGTEAALMGENDGCGYVWEEVGHGMESVAYDLMQRDLRTRPICVKDIRTFWQYQETQNLIFQNLANISANMREQLNRNSALMFAHKYVALPNLPLSNDPHQFPVIPTGVEVGKLTYGLVLQLYHFLAQEASQYALGTMDGGPAFGIAAHPETLYSMYMEDAQIRTDLRKCAGTVCDLISRYNFLDGIGPFILMPDPYAPRYDRKADGTLYRVFPFDRAIPIELGTRPATNPAYYTAEFEFVQFMIRDLFTLRTRRPITTVGGQTDFEPETGLFDWKWHNPPRCEDHLRRTGRYVATAEIGVEPGDFTDVPGILVKRRPGYAGIQYWDAEICPPTPVDCDNVLPAEACPCPLVTFVGPAAADDELIVEFNRDPDVAVASPVLLETPNGSFVSATVEEISSDGLRYRVSFAEDVVARQGMFVGVQCGPIGSCSAKVLKTTTCGITAGTPVVTVTLDKLLKNVVATDTITLIMCDGEQLASVVALVDGAALEYNVGITWANYCLHEGICSVCVPTATEATCPGCDVTEFELCVES